MSATPNEKYIGVVHCVGLPTDTHPWKIIPRHPTADILCSNDTMKEIIRARQNNPNIPLVVNIGRPLFYSIVDGKKQHR